MNTKRGDNDGESDSSSDGDLVVSWKADKEQQQEEQDEEKLEFTPEKLAELDAQTNPFNFSERVSQTSWNKLKVNRQE